MSLTFEKVVQEDLNVGIGTTTVTNPGGGSLSATQVGIHTVGIGQSVTTSTWSVGAIADGAALNKDIAVAGAAVGDFVLASHTKMLTDELSISAHVSAADTVKVVISNSSGASVTPGSGTASVLVFKSR